MSSVQPWTNRACLFAAAGLLHDVGKVAEHAGEELPRHIHELEQMICPTDRKTQRATHRHVLYTALLLDRAIDAKATFGGLDGGDLFRLACNHHRPSGDRFDEHLVQKADHLASGHDRRQAEDDSNSQITGMLAETASVKTSSGAQPNSGRRVEDEPWWLQTARADDVDAFLPGQRQSMEEYRRRCAALTEELERSVALAAPDALAYVESLDAALRLALVNVPSSRSRGETPDVSLYDHSRIVACFASCLALLHPQDDGPCDLHRIDGQLRFVSLKLGGVQGFIFRSAPALGEEAGRQKGRAKTLRARSFLVTALSRLAARCVLRRCGLPSTHLVLEAGAKSVLLLPDNEEALRLASEAIEAARGEIVSMTGSLLRLDAAVSDPLPLRAFDENAFGATWRRVAEGLERAKLHGLAPSLRENGSWRSDGWVGDRPGLPLETPPLRDQIEQLGKQLPKATHLVVREEAGDSAQHALQFMDMRVEVEGRNVVTKGARRFALELAAWTAGDSLMLAGSYAPTVDKLQDLARRAEVSFETTAGEPVAPFDLLSKLATDANGEPVGQDMLGVLKADVDRLGLLLGYGFGQRASLGRLASFSRRLDAFFKVLLMGQLRSCYPCVYTLYAGGDDLFLVGPWYDTARLLRELHKWFVKFACGRLTISAGLVFTKPNTPIDLMASAVEEALQRSKEEGRNRVTVAGATMPWSAYSKAWALHEQLNSLLTEEQAKVSRSLVYRLLLYGARAERVAVGKSVSLDDLGWRAQMSYDLRRNLRDDDPEVDRLRTTLVEMSNGSDAAAVLRTAAALTLYRSRKERVG